MSSSHHHTAQELPVQVQELMDQWETHLVPQLPADLEEYAWRLGAMRRRAGKVLQASDLLRALLVYAVGLRSFRQLGLWGLLLELADLADTSWRERLLRSSPWLSWIFGRLLTPAAQEPVAWLAKEGYDGVELVDATNITCPGPKGLVWRLHCSYDLHSQQLRQVHVTTKKVAEHLQHFTLKAGVIYVMDSGYGYRDRVARCLEARAHCAIAFTVGSFPVLDEAGQVFDVLAWLKSRRARPGFVGSHDVWFEHKGKRYRARIVALRLTKEQAAQRRRRKKRKASANGHKMQAKTAYLAGWLVVVTTLAAQDWSAQEVLTIYRARWHVELLFKRIKQFLRQQQLRAITEESARATVYALLIRWLLQQEMAGEVKAAMERLHRELMGVKTGEEEEMPSDPEAPYSEWQVQGWCSQVVSQQIMGEWKQPDLQRLGPALRRHLKEPKRKRRQWWYATVQWLVGKGAQPGCVRKAASPTALAPPAALP